MNFFFRLLNSTLSFFRSDQIYFILNRLTKLFFRVFFINFFHSIWRNWKKSFLLIECRRYLVIDWPMWTLKFFSKKNSFFFYTCYSETHFFLNWLNPFIPFIDFILLPKRNIFFQKKKIKMKKIMDIYYYGRHRSTYHPSNQTSEFIYCPFASVNSICVVFRIYFRTHCVICNLNYRLSIFFNI